MEFVGIFQSYVAVHAEGDFFLFICGTRTSMAKMLEAAENKKFSWDKK